MTIITELIFSWYSITRCTTPTGTATAAVFSHWLWGASVSSQARPTAAAVFPHRLRGSSVSSQTHAAFAPGRGKWRYAINKLCV